MSTAAAGGRSFGNAKRQSVADEPLPAAVFQWLVVAIDAFILAFGLARGWIHVEGNWVAILMFALLIGIAGSLTLQTGRASLGFDLPLLLAVGLLFGPFTVGAVALLAVFDIREFRGEVGLRLSLFNRAEISLSAMAGTFAFFATGASLSDWPWTALAGVLALIVDTLVNYALVAGYWRLRSGRSFLSVVKEMHVGPPRSFVLTYGCFGFLGVLIAELYTGLGVEAALAFVILVGLGRETFTHRHLLDQTARSLAQKDRVLRGLSKQVATERRDERMLLAGELHDEVLPPLFQVHLMGQVLKQDLASGRLLDLDRDLPPLLDATDAANGVVRKMAKGLRKSSLGPGGLVPSIQGLARTLENLGAPPISLELADVHSDEDTQFIAYQIVRESLRNATRYSRASSIRVRVSEAEGNLSVIVADDGIGFDPGEVDETEHLGLQLIAERVAASGGRLVVDSRLGSGTLVAASLPTGPAGMSDVNRATSA